MIWQSVDTQQDLDAFNTQVRWEDSESLKYLATTQNESWFPADVNRSGNTYKNVFLLCRASSQVAPYLEMVWIDCEFFFNVFADHPFMTGQVDTLKRVVISDWSGETQMRCSRLVYRFRNEIMD